MGRQTQLTNKPTKTWPCFHMGNRSFKLGSNLAPRLVQVEQCVVVLYSFSHDLIYLKLVLQWSVSSDIEEQTERTGLTIARVNGCGSRCGPAHLGFWPWTVISDLINRH